MQIDCKKKELELIYAALISYGDKLSSMAKEIPNEENIVDKLSNKAAEAWQLAEKTAKLLSE